MSERCAECGAKLPRADAPCPACLMNLAMDDVVRAEASLESDASALEAEARIGSSIGPYTLERILGEGGMGVVYLAQQTEPIERRVALKVIKIGMDTREVLTRFDVERQTLALMDHPYIARVIDAGATSGGRPFFVMELVEGTPITEYCDAGRLEVGGRIELVLAVCEAIQHAHLKGIIHRDLKPSNVLVAEVDGKPVPKVIDFGLAKATRRSSVERTAFTRLGRLIGTPEYMSPEQAGLIEGDVDTRTDLYSLGILLYEILAGAPPLDAKHLRETGLDGLLQQIRNAPSPRPSMRVSSLGAEGIQIANNRRTSRSTLLRRLQGDLDWVVMKAIEKDRERRYATVQELATELRRYLNGEPVEAGPPGAWYRIGKFVRRHRLGVGATAAVTLALALGTLGTSVGWLRSVRSEHRATAEAATAQQVSDFMIDLFRSSRPADAPPESITAPQLLEKGAEKIRTELADRPLIQARMMFTIAGAYASLGMYDQAQSLGEDALQIRDRELPTDHPDRGASLEQLGLFFVETGRFAESEARLEKALSLYDRALEPNDTRRLPALINLGVVYLKTGRFGEAEPLMRRAIEIGEQDVGRGNPELALVYTNLGTVLLALGRLEEAESVLATALEGMREQVGEDHVRYADTLVALAGLYQRQHKLDDAIELLEQAVEIQERVLGMTHNDLAQSLGNLAVCYAMQGRYDEAAPRFSRVVKIAEQLHGPDSVDVGKGLINVGNIRRDLGDYDAAEEAYRRAIAILEHKLGGVESTALAYGNLAGLRGRTGDDEASLELHRRALEIREKSLGPKHARTAMSIDNVAATLRDLGRFDEAEPLFVRALAIREETLPRDHPNIAKSLHGIAILYREQGREAEAIETFERAIAMRRKSLGSEHPSLARSLAAYAVLQRDRGRYGEAESLFEEALSIMDAKYPGGHPQMLELLEDYGALMRQTGRAEQAVKLEQRRHEKPETR